MRLEMPEVETARLWLRPAELADAGDMYEYYKNPDVTGYLSLQPHHSVDETLSMLKGFVLPYLKRGVPQTWVMELKDCGCVIGDLCIHTIEDDIGEIGYVLHPDYWGCGYMYEALQELVDVGFAHVGLRRMEAYCAKEHRRSIRLLEACGFRKEGVCREYAKLSDGEYHDMILWSILKKERLL